MAHTGEEMPHMGKHLLLNTHRTSAELEINSKEIPRHLELGVFL